MLCSPAPDRDDVAALIIPDLDACRQLAPDLAPDTQATSVLGHARVRRGIRALLTELSAPSRGTSARVRRAILLVEPPSLDVGEMTDKGSINQRAVLAHRAHLVEDLYADPPPGHVIVAPFLARGGRPTSQAS